MDVSAQSQSSEESIIPSKQPFYKKPLFIGVILVLLVLWGGFWLNFLGIVKVPLLSSLSIQKKLSPEQMIESFVKETVKPEFQPSQFSPIERAPKQITSNTDRKQFKLKYTVQDTEMEVRYYETPFDSRPLDISVFLSIDYPGFLQLSSKEKLKALERYFVSLPQDYSLNEYLHRPNPAVEAIWDNQDGSLESRGIVLAPNEDNSQSFTSYLFACRLFKDSPLYEKKTCIEGVK
ncbi:hypothetical protein HYV21_01655 [Candidatus Microgenomates bacterium]|nr:hypothetical protein [Candidatus Microgenomates bacterium]